MCALQFVLNPSLTKEKTKQGLFGFFNACFSIRRKTEKTDSSEKQLSRNSFHKVFILNSLNKVPGGNVKF